MGKHDTASRLKEALIMRNMKQIELSVKTGIVKSAISQYLSGKIIPKQDKIFLLSTALDVSPTWLMGYDVGIEDEQDKTRTEVLNKNDEVDIAKRLMDIISDLESKQSKLIFQGEPMTEVDIELIKVSLENTLRLAKIKVKE